MFYQEYVREAQKQIERRRRLADQEKIQTDAFLVSINKTMELIHKKRAEIDSKSNADKTDQLDALWKYVKDLDCILDGLEKSCTETIVLRQSKLPSNLHR